MRTLFLFFASLLMVSLQAQPIRTIDRFRAEQVFQQGVEAYEAKDYGNALQAFNEVERLHPGQARLYEFRAEAFYHLNRFDDALADYTRALATDPGNPELYNSRGVAAARLQRYEDAMDNFYQAIRLDPGHESAKKNLEIAQRRLQEVGSGAQSNTLPSNRPYQPPLQGQSGVNFPDYVPPPTLDLLTPAPGFSATGPTRSDDLPAQPTERSYGADKFIIAGQNDPLVIIRNVKITPANTQITFEVNNAGDQPFPIVLDRPGQAGALYLTDRTFTRTYRLRTVRNLRGWPTTPHTLRPGEAPVQFVAEFDRLDDDVTVFHILEGSENRAYAWDFFDVKLLQN